MLSSKSEVKTTGGIPDIRVITLYAIKGESKSAFGKLKPPMLEISRSIGGTTKGVIRSLQLVDQITKHPL